MDSVTYRQFNISQFFQAFFFCILLNPQISVALFLNLLIRFCWGFFLRYFLKSSFRFTAKLRGRDRDFPYTAYFPHMHNLHIVNIPYKSSTFITIDEPTLTRLYYPKSTVHLKTHFCCCTFCGSTSIFFILVLSATLTHQQQSCEVDAIVNLI